MVKAALRQRMKGLLAQLSAKDIETRSAALTEQLLSLPCVQQAQGVSCFLSMPSGEVRTDLLLQHLLPEALEVKTPLAAVHTGNVVALQKRVFVPKITGKAPQDMQMLEVKSLACLDGYPKNRWGIPEPPFPSPAAAEDATIADLIDVVLVPGVVFDCTCGRLGHGRGYYDSFLTRLARARRDGGGAQSVAVGLCFDEQVLEGEEVVPLEAHDVPLDFVVTPTRVLSRGGGRG